MHFISLPFFSKTGLNRSLHGGLFLLIGVLPSCTIYNEHSLPDLLPHSAKPILYLKDTAPSGMSSVFWKELGTVVEQELSTNSWYGPIKDKSVQQKHWQSNQQLKLDQYQFQTSLALAGITERTLATRLMKGMQVKQTLLFQFIIFPCTDDCTSPENWLLRLQLVDLGSGEQIHRVRLLYKPGTEELSGLPRQETARAQVRGLVEKFNEGFLVPWHRLRYENLKLLTSLEDDATAQKD